MTRTALTLIGLVLLACTLAPVAEAASRAAIIKDCARDEKLDGTYTAAELRDARLHLDGDVAEYTGCAALLLRAEQALRAAQARPTAVPSGGATATPQQGTPAGEPDPNDKPTQFDAPDLAAAQKAGDQPVKLGDVKLVPASGVRVERSQVPSTVWLAVAALLAAGACLLVPALRRRLVPLLRRRG